MIMRCASAVKRDHVEWIAVCVRARAKSYVARRYGVYKAHENVFDDFWQDVLLAICELVERNEWDMDRDDDRIAKHVCFMVLTRYRREHRKRSMANVGGNLHDIEDVPKPDAEPEGGPGSVMYEAAMEALAKMRPARSLYLYELMAMVSDGTCPVQCFNSGMVKKLHQRMCDNGQQRKFSTMYNAVRRSRDELWQALLDMGVVSGERPKVTDRQGNGPSKKEGSW